MTYVLPANRNNGYTKRYKAELYPMPKSDKTGYLTRLTLAANNVLAKVTYKYAVGMRVRAKTKNIQYGGRWLTGTIQKATYNIGLIEYVIKEKVGDSHINHIIPQHHVTDVLSIKPIETKAIVIYQPIAA